MTGCFGLCALGPIVIVYPEGAFYSQVTEDHVDEIVDELARDPRVAKAYDLWYEMREEVLRTYKNDLPERLPLSRQKEFKSIKNMVIREAEELRLGAFTFEDTTMKDEVDEDQEAVYNIWNSRRQMS